MFAWILGQQRECSNHIKPPPPPTCLSHLVFRVDFGSPNGKFRTIRPYLVMAMGQTGHFVEEFTSQARKGVRITSQPWAWPGRRSTVGASHRASAGPWRSDLPHRWPYGTYGTWEVARRDIPHLGLGLGAGCPCCWWNLDTNVILVRNKMKSIPPFFCGRILRSKNVSFRGFKIVVYLLN